MPGTKARYEAICEPPDDRFMIFDVHANQPAAVSGVLLIGLSQQDADWIVLRLNAGETLSKNYLQALKSMAHRR